MKDYAGYLEPFRPIIAAMLIAGQTRGQVAKLLYAVGARGSARLNQAASHRTFSHLIRHMEKRWSMDDELEPKNQKVAMAKPAYDDDAEIDVLDLPTMTANALRRDNIRTVGQLRAQSNAVLLRIQNLGRVGLKRIRDRIGSAKDEGGRHGEVSNDAYLERMIRRVVREEIRSLLANLMPP